MLSVQVSGKAVTVNMLGNQQGPYLFVGKDGDEATSLYLKIKKEMGA